MDDPSADLFRSDVQRARSVVDGKLAGSTGSTLAGKRGLGRATVLAGLTTGKVGLIDGTSGVETGPKIAVPVGMGACGTGVTLEGNSTLFDVSSGFAIKVGTCESGAAS